MAAAIAVNLSGGSFEQHVASISFTADADIPSRTLFFDAQRALQAPLNVRLRASVHCALILRSFTLLGPLVAGARCRVDETRARGVQHEVGRLARSVVRWVRVRALRRCAASLSALILLRCRSWATRGFHSRWAFAFLCDAVTGAVLDYYVMERQVEAVTSRRVIGERVPASAHALEPRMLQLLLTRAHAEQLNLAKIVCDRDSSSSSVIERVRRRPPWYLCARRPTSSYPRSDSL